MPELPVSTGPAIVSPAFRPSGYTSAKQNKPADAMTKAPGLQELPRILLAVLFLAAAIVACLWILKPFLPALIWATLIVVSTWPLMQALQKRVRGRRGLAVIVMTVVMLLVVIVPIALAVLTIVEHADDFGDALNTLAHAALPAPPGWVEQLPFIGPKLAAEWKAVAALSADELHARIAPYAREIAPWILGKAGTVAAFFLHLLLTVVIAAMLYYKGEVAAGGVHAFARRLAGPRGEHAVTLAGQAIRAVALGVVVTAFVQAVAGGIGLAVVGVPLASFLTALMFVLAVAQIGAAPVLALAVAWLYWSGSPTWGTALLVWTVIVGSMDNVMRPILIRRGVDLPMVLIFAGVIGGLLAFGVVGLFVGPVVLAVVYTQISAWVGDGGE
jgi:predicted PurR-regulated permease PerM